ncbi:MAG TPA: methylmalonyl-CoA mutase family protein, partial [Bacteroidia bacterium]|nr:methylmalonyl-CoA mutase family protein [Bacteroidia bacterium]
MQAEVTPYIPKNKIRIVTAASLFDGHDAAINIMRRIMQASGAEVIHLGHDRSALDVVNCAIQEDANAIAMTSYQGGHNEYLKYMLDLLKEQGCGHIKIFAGGGGVILPDEIKDLHKYGITRIYSPDDGRKMGLQGMINDILQKCDEAPKVTDIDKHIKGLKNREAKSIAALISLVEDFPDKAKEVHKKIQGLSGKKVIPVLGITGVGGAGKSSLIDELLRRYLIDFSAKGKIEEGKTIAILCVDPSKRKTGGALLGDRIRMNALGNTRVYMRSLATRQSHLALSQSINKAVDILKACNFDLILLETSGIGQSDTEVVDCSDVSLYVMTPEYGAATQLEKIDMLDFADVIAINKFDKRGAQDALRDVKKQFKRNHNLFTAKDSELPVFGTIASQFNDPGMNSLYKTVIDTVAAKTKADLHSSYKHAEEQSQKIFIIPPDRVRYLSEITETVRGYGKWAISQSEIAEKLYALHRAEEMLGSKPEITKKKKELEEQLTPANKKILEGWEKEVKQYTDEYFIYNVRGKDIKVKTHTESLSHTLISKIAVPRYRAWGEILHWVLQENFPGKFPYTAGVYPFKRSEEDPTRMFAGEGGPERTNKRFHYVSAGMPAKRLSTAFDSVTLYGRDPDHRPDIYGKIGNSGVSICCLDDAKKLYSGFNLCDPKTSVSMTINGPASIIAAFFMNAAIDQQCELYIKEHKLEKQVQKKIDDIYKKKGVKRPAYQGALPKGNDGLGLMLLGITGEQVLPKDVYEKIKAFALSQVRGTVQADILKEDQAQNTCIFSTEFSLRLMGDVQQYFINNKVRNFYSVSISGYHIAEAGANPISQVAFTIANGFTFVEYYLSRGMNINDFAPNLSFFFSNGIDPEYAVIGRVARRIWAKAMKLKYGADERSQMLKYHIQTSGRSLHAQEIDFNDIRTTLQALYAIYDNCNSLHTNAYDEAITTPTEESVRRAIAIQLIINRELGLAKNENPLQGSF